MLRVVVHVKREGESKGRDLELPAEIPLEQWLPNLATALKWPEAASGRGGWYRVRADPPGRELDRHETLAEAGVWDGANLLFIPISPEPGDFFLESASGMRYPLRVSPVCLGRRRWGAAQAEGAEELIDLSAEPDGPTVSHAHARLAFGDGVWTVTLGERVKNPTYVNEDLLSEGAARAKKEGDCLRLGGVTLWLRHGAGEAGELKLTDQGLSPPRLRRDDTG